MSTAVLTAPLEGSTCPYHQSLLSFSMRSRSSIPSRVSSSMDLMVAVSCGLTLQICLIIALSFRCRRWRQGFVTGQVSLAWSIALHTHVQYTRPHVLKEKWREERTGLSSLNFFQAVFTRVVWFSSNIKSRKEPCTGKLAQGVHCYAFCKILSMLTEVLYCINHSKCPCSNKRPPPPPPCLFFLE